METARRGNKGVQAPCSPKLGFRLLAVQVLLWIREPEI
jgi:hypothetical protein